MNIDVLIDKLEALGDDLLPTLQKGLNKGLLVMSEDAQNTASVMSGELRNGIGFDSEIVENGVDGEVFSNALHSMPVELGAGPKGEGSLSDVPPLVNPKYKQTGWWIHVGGGKGDIHPYIVNRYHMFTVKNEDGETFAYTEGQAAKPFLYPAYKNTKDTLVNEIAKALNEGIKESL